IDVDHAKQLTSSWRLVNQQESDCKWRPSNIQQRDGKQIIGSNLVGRVPSEGVERLTGERLTRIEKQGDCLAQAGRSEICDESLPGAVGRIPNRRTVNVCHDDQPRVLVA